MQFCSDANHTGSFDVIVVGGGPSGIAAAIAASRKKVKTLLIERSGCLGGTSTIGALPFWLGISSGSIPYLKMLEKGLQYQDLPREKQVVAGIYLEAINCIKAEHGGIGPAALAQTDLYPGLDRLGCHDEFTFDLECGKRVLEQMVLKEKAEIKYFTSALSPKVTEGTIDGIFMVNKDGLSYASCKTVVDCSGDADIVHRAGYQTYKGDRETGNMAIASLIIHIENVDSARVEAYLNAGGDPWFRAQCTRAKADYPDGNFNDSIIMFPMIQPGVFMINGGTGFIHIDGTSSRDLSFMMHQGRLRAFNLVEKLFKPYIPGFEHARIRLTALYPGIRETRRIVAEYTLTEEDLISGKKFNDVIALAGRHFDLARPAGRSDGSYYYQQPFQEKNVSVAAGITPIPYRTLIPKDSRNIIAAGRCIAADGQALGPVRIMSTCFATGQAAGTAAALSVQKNRSFIELDINEIRSILAKDGAIIDY